jgi:hypothetical protein
MHSVVILIFYLTLYTIRNISNRGYFSSSLHYVEQTYKNANVNVNINLHNCPDTSNDSNANFMKQIYLTDQTQAKHYKCPHETPGYYRKTLKCSMISQ